MPVLGYPTPSRFMPPTVGASFPHLPAQASDAAGTIIVPPGALDRWFAYRATKGAVRKSITAIGDSTTAGAEATGAGYTWLTRVRGHAITDGIADGGKGIFAAGENLDYSDVPGEVVGFVSTTMDGAPDSFDPLNGQFFYDQATTANRTLSLQFKGTAARLWYSARFDVGDFTYSLDGGAPVLVQAHSPAGTVNMTYLSGLTDTLHTLVITNLAGRPALPPAGVTAGGGGIFATNPLANGTYYYVATYVFGGGETIASNEVTVTTANSQTVTVVVPEVGQDSINIYRGTSPGGPYSFVTSTRTGFTSTVNLFLNDSTQTPNGSLHPPTVGTTNRNTSAKKFYGALSPLRNTGAVFERYATSGASMAQFNGVSSGWKAWSGLGLVDPTGARNLSSSWGPDTALGANRPDPVLAILDLGFNDLTGGDGSAAAATCATGVDNFAAMCTAAGCDGLVLSGNLPVNANYAAHGADVLAALRDTALSHGLAFANLWTPVQVGDYSTGNPHLYKVGYQRQGDWLWNNVLGAKG